MPIFRFDLVKLNLLAISLVQFRATLNFFLIDDDPSKTNSISTSLGPKAKFILIIVNIKS